MGRHSGDGLRGKHAACRVGTPAVFRDAGALCCCVSTLPLSQCVCWGGREVCARARARVCVCVCVLEVVCGCVSVLCADM